MTENAMHTRCWIMLLALAGCAPQPTTPEGAPHARTVAVTFDDLPWARAIAVTPPQAAELTSRLVGRVKDAGVPAVGFVNEAKFAHPSTPATLLHVWADAGLELGNHTYSHRSFFTTPLDTFQLEVLRGEEVTRPLMARRGQRLRYFRHPFLNTGPDLATKDAFERFLARNRYRVAPVTVDTEDYRFAVAYDHASARGDSTALRRIGAEYVRHTDTSFAYYEGLGRSLEGREPAQILLLHANRLNADYFGELVALLRRRGYTFVTLERALRDPAYRQPDRYAGRAGMSWLQRWAITRRVRFEPEPTVPAWIVEAGRPPQ